MWRRRGRDCAGRGASEGAATTRENREATRHTGPMGFKEKRRKEKGEILKQKRLPFHIHKQKFDDQNKMSH